MTANETEPAACKRSCRMAMWRTQHSHLGDGVGGLGAALEQLRHRLARVCRAEGWQSVCATEAERSWPACNGLAQLHLSCPVAGWIICTSHIKHCSPAAVFCRPGSWLCISSVRACMGGVHADGTTRQLASCGWPGRCCTLSLTCTGIA